MVGDWRPTLGYWGSLNFCSTIISKVNFHVDEHTLLWEKAALHFLGFIIFAAANTSHGCYIVNDWYYLIMRHSGSLIIFALYIYDNGRYICLCMLLMYGLLICQHEINQMDIVTWWCIGQDLDSWGITWCKAHKTFKPNARISHEVPTSI